MSNSREKALENLDNFIGTYTIDMSGVNGVKTYLLNIIFRLELAYESLVAGKPLNFLEMEVKDVLEYCGFSVKHRKNGEIDWTAFSQE